MVIHILTLHDTSAARHDRKSSKLQWISTMHSGFITDSIFIICEQLFMKFYKVMSILYFLLFFRSPPFDRELAERVIGDFEQTGMTLDDIMLQHIFRRDSREVVLKVIQDIRPEFKHPQPPIQPVCSLEVVKELYTEPMASPAVRNRVYKFIILQHSCNIFQAA